MLEQAGQRAEPVGAGPQVHEPPRHQHPGRPDQPHGRRIAGVEELRHDLAERGPRKAAAVWADACAAINKFTTRRQGDSGDKEKTSRFSLSPCLPVSLSPCLILHGHSLRPPAHRRRRRRGRLHTPHGIVETPVFMPVGTQATVKGLTPEQLDDGRRQIILGNTYHLTLRPGDELIAELGGLHRFMGWHGPILTDSGGFQVYSLAPTAQDHRPGGRLSLAHRRRPAGADARTRRRHPGKPRLRHRHVPGRMPAGRHAGAITCARGRRAAPSLWAERCRDAHRRPIRPCSPSSRAAPTWTCAADVPRHWRRSIFPATPWAASASARRRSRCVAALGPTAALLPADKPRYLMGVGRPRGHPRRRSRCGIDMFDCVLPTRNGRNASAFTDDGALRLRNACHKRDPAPLESDCPCYTCRHFSRAYLHHLFLARGDAGADAAVAAQCRLLLPADGRDPAGHRGRPARRVPGSLSCPLEPIGLR